jgi:hypothetical protein
MWPTQPLIQWLLGPISQELKLPGREAEHSPLPSAEIKNSGATPPLPHTGTICFVNYTVYPSITNFLFSILIFY